MVKPQFCHPRPAPCSFAPGPKFRISGVFLYPDWYSKHITEVAAPIHVSVSLSILSPLDIRTPSHLNSSNWTPHRPGASNKAALNWPRWRRVLACCQFWASFPLQVLILWRRLFKSCEDRVCLTCAQPQQASEPAGACWELQFHILYDMKLFQVFFTAKKEIKAENQPLLGGTTDRYASPALWLHCKKKLPVT